MSEEKLCIEDIITQKFKLKQALEDLPSRCSHKYKNGEDATVGVPVSAERFCRACGTIIE